MTHTDMDAAHTASDDSAQLTRSANAMQATMAARRAHVWRTWLGVIAAALMALLALVQILSADVAAATLAPDAVQAPDNTARAPSDEVVQAVPFL